VKTFKDNDTALLYEVEAHPALPAHLLVRGRMQLHRLTNASCFDDIKRPSSNELSQGNDANKFTIAIGEGWVVAFEWVFGRAYEINIEKKRGSAKNKMRT